MTAKTLIGVVALPALPGSPRYGGSNQAILDTAIADILSYKAAGVNGIKLINDYDIPYAKPPLPKDASVLFKQIAMEARKQFSGIIGIEVLEGDNETALQIAHEAKLDFVRAHAFVFACVGISGLFEGCAGKLLRSRRNLGADNIKIYADIKKKHCAHALTADLDIVDEAIQAEQCLADGLIVTGMRTSEKTNASDVQRVKSISKLPVFVGSGITVENLAEFFPVADGFIVGSHFRKDGNFLEALDKDRLHKFVDKFEALG